MPIPLDRNSFDLLLHDAQAGDLDALGQLLEYSRSELLWRVRRPGRHFALLPRDDEDRAQEAICDAWQRLDSFHGDWDGVQAWLGCILERRRCDEYRRRQRRKRGGGQCSISLHVSRDEGHMVESAIEDQSPDRVLLRREVQSALRAEIAGLPAAQLHAIDLLLQGLDHGQIAVLLGCSIDAIRMRLARAVLHLRSRADQQN